jgi:hypothetical protein
MRDALQRGPLDVTAWAPRRQLDARRRDPPEAVQLRAADRMLLSLKTTRDERAAFGWGSPFAVGLSAFFVVAVLVGLAIHWAGILQSR